MSINIKILVGISSSGKSTFAKNYVKTNLNTKRINRDDIRNMMDDGRYSNSNEKFTKKVRNELIYLCILNDKNIIIDDTNCAFLRLKGLIDFIRITGKTLKKELEIEILDFDTDIAICKERNKTREAPIDNKVFNFMKNDKYQINFEDLDVDKITKMTN